MEVHFQEDYLKGAVKVYLIEWNGSHKQFYTKGGAEVRTPQEGEQLKDEDIMFASIPTSALPAFAEALSKRGIKTDNDHKIAGTLEATKYHLEDMRKLAKVKE